jgi:DNA-binding NtrC family response regulator
MGNKDKSVLVVDDDLHMRLAMEAVMKRQGYACRAVSSAREAKAALQEASYDVVVTDMCMENRTAGLDVIKAAIQGDPDMPVIVLTGRVNGDNAVQAMEAGAYDYLGKPIDIDELESIVTAAMISRLEPCTDTGPETVPNAPFQHIITVDPGMEDMLDMIRQIADTNVPVLVQGETGTGKELIARAVHNASRRSQRDFITVNCGALSDSLLESELFGHVKGSFTGADKDRLGAFRAAEGGTLFLDEIGDMPMSAQVALLRALQEGEVTPVGFDRPIKVDVRVVAATHQDLEACVEAGTFREDLFYRLNVLPIEVPPLRERRRDVLALAIHFIRRVNQRQQRRVLGLEVDIIEPLLRFPWPGNVRQLENELKRMVILRRNGLLGKRDLSRKVSQFDPDAISGKLCTLPVSSEEIPDKPIYISDDITAAQTHTAPETLDGGAPDSEAGAPPRAAGGGQQQRPMAADAWFEMLFLPPEGLDMRQLTQRLENVLLLRALEMADENRSQAARLLRLNRTTLVERLRRMEERDEMDLNAQLRLLEEVAFSHTRVKADPW